MSDPSQSGRTTEAREGIELRLLGGFRLLAADGSPIDLPTRKSRLLLAYLASPSGQAHSREKLADLFWPDAQEEQARASLRHALAALKSALIPLAIEAGRESIMLAPGRLRIDVDILNRAAREKGAADVKDIGRIYRGEFLDGDSLSSPDFEDWLIFERTRCRNLAQSAFEQAIAALESCGQANDAILLAERLVALDPLREQSHRVLMRVFEAAGERSKALEQYQRLTELLKRELSVDPSPQSSALAKQLLIQEQGVANPATSPIAEKPAGKPSPTPPGPLSIVVLPFACFSDASDDQLIAQAFTEDVITELSRLRELSVIASMTSAQYATAATTVAAKDLGVRYAVTGTLRRSANRIRITAQLINAAGSRSVWAERYDRETADTFAILDDIVAQIGGTLDAQIRRAERERAAHIGGDIMGAWELAHRGLWHVCKFTRADTEAADPWFRKSIELSPNFFLPYAGLAFAALAKATWRLSDDLPGEIAKGIANARKAVDLDPSSAYAHCILGRLLMLAGKLDDAFSHLGRSLELNPSYAQAHLGLAQAHLWAGTPDQALGNLAEAERMSPKDPMLGVLLTYRAFAQFSLGDFVAAEASARRASQVRPREVWARLALAATLAASGRPQEARAAIDAALAIDPSLSMKGVGPFVHHIAKSQKEAVLAALKVAGLE